MRPSRLLRSVSVRIPSRLTAPVVPWPLQSPLDRWLGSELEALRRRAGQPENYLTASWLLDGLEVTVATYKLAAEPLAFDTRSGSRPEDRETIDEHLEDVIDLLDTCNGLRGTLESLGKYVESLRVALHFAEGEPNAASMRRVRLALDSCAAMERRCTELDKCGSTLRRLGEKMAPGGMRTACGGTSSNGGIDATCEPEFYKALCASKAVALLVCGALVIALSFKSRRGLPAAQLRPSMSWCGCLRELHGEIKEEIEKRRRKTGSAALNELRTVVKTAREFRDMVFQLPDNKHCRSELRNTIEGLRKSCEELEQGVKAFERQVNELYRKLISIRMLLLGILTEVKR